MLRTLKTEYSTAEYLAMEEVSPEKHEFYQGQIYMMAGGSADHSLVCVNVASELRSKLGAKPCRVFNSDLRLYVPDVPLLTYPDVMVICGKLEFFHGRTDTVTNPSVIIEVASPTTRKYDRTDKFKFYKTIPTLREYILVESSRPHIERFWLQGRRWTGEMFTGLDETLAIAELDCEIEFLPIYEKVSWR